MSWKDYLRFHLIEHYAGVLPKTVAAEDFAFYGTILSGAQQRRTAATAPSPPPTPHWARRSANSIHNVISRLKRKRRRKPWSPT